MPSFSIFILRSIFSIFFFFHLYRTRIAAAYVVYIHIRSYNALYIICNFQNAIFLDNRTTLLSVETNINTISLMLINFNYRLINLICFQSLSIYLTSKFISIITNYESIPIFVLFVKSTF